MRQSRLEEEQLASVTKDLKACGHALATQGLVWGHSGNISTKVQQETFLISATGADLGALRNDDLVRCHIHTDTFTGVRPPSMERGLHQAIYQVADDVVAVLHSQPFYTTLVACSDIDIKTDLFPEAMAYLDPIERVPYHHAGSPSLAQDTAAKACSSRCLLLNNHGAVCWGSSIEEALIRTETLELLCRLVVLSQASDIALNYLGQETVASFREHLKLVKGV